MVPSGILSLWEQRGVEVRFKSRKLQLLFEKDEGAAKYPAGVADAFTGIVQYIQASANEQDLYAVKSLRFEKLKGPRGKQGERSLRLNDQFRLIVKIEETDEGRYIQILRIEDYH